MSLELCSNGIATQVLGQIHTGFCSTFLLTLCLLHTCALAKTEEVSFKMSLLHSVFLSSGDLNNTPRIYQQYLSLKRLLSSSPIPLLSKEKTKDSNQETAAAHHSSLWQLWTTQSFEVLPSSALSHFLLSNKLGRGCSSWIMQWGETCSGRL